MWELFLKGDKVFKNWNWEHFFWTLVAIAALGSAVALSAIISNSTKSDSVVIEAREACGKKELQSIEWEVVEDSYGDPDKQIKSLLCK